ncbi:MAG: Gfo/Idh/MocA family protein [Bacteroidales bacterium]
MSEKKTSRRDFMKTSAAIGMASIVAPYIIPSKVMGAPGRTGANDKITLGGIGVGNRGGALLSAFNRFEDVTIAAVADADMNRCREIGEVYGADAYQDYRQLLDRDDIDGVVIASPDHWHALHSIHAAQAGKDIYCEKSLTLTVREGRQMVKAARKYNRVFQTGSQQRSSSGFYRACMLIRNGYIGKIKKIVGVNYPGPWENALPGGAVPDGLDWDMWCGPAPLHPYHPEVKNNRGNPGWLSIRDFCGGEITGWGTHGIDQIQWALGMDEGGPVEIWTVGNPYKPWVAQRPDRTGRFYGSLDPVIHMKYPGDIHVEFSEMANPNGGALFIGEKGEIRVDRGTLELPDEGWYDIPLDNMETQLYTSANHQRNWIDCMRDRSRPVTDVEIGHRSATVCHLGNIARWISERTQQTGARLIWDPEQERFTNNDWGNFYLDRPSRKKYSMPDEI